MILGLRPLVESGWIATERGIVADCKSGATGAGKEPKKELHFAEVDENFRAYGLFSHRHTPEVTDHTGIAGEDIVFTTHLLPVARGILSTLYVWFAEPHTAEEVESLYRAFYADRPMMRSGRPESCRSCSMWRTRIFAISDLRSIPRGGASRW